MEEAELKGGGGPFPNALQKKGKENKNNALSKQSKKNFLFAPLHKSNCCTMCVGGSLGPFRDLPSLPLLTPISALFSSSFVGTLGVLDTKGERCEGQVWSMRRRLPPRYLHLHVSTDGFAPLALYD